MVDSTFKKLSIATFLLVVLIYSTKLVLTQCGEESAAICSREDNTRLIIDLKKEIGILSAKLKIEEQLMVEKICHAEEKSALQSVPKIDRPLWEQGNVRALSGCWILDWNYELIEVDTKESVGVSSWDICFEVGTNKGQQNLIFDNNVKCTDASIEGQFSILNTGTKLNLDDLSDINCDGKWTIFRRQIQCELTNEDTAATCISRQFREGSWGEFGGPDIRLKRRGP